MHPYEILVIDFMKRIGASSLDVEEKLLKPASKDVEHFIRKLYEDDPNRPFAIRMSNIGKPLCQLQMDKAGANKVENDWNFALRMMYGGVIEGLAVNILRLAGVPIEEEQTQVKLPVANIEINGTLDLVIDGKVWDIKSASPYSFKEKFQSYESLKEQDHFGYLCQLYGYAKARGVAPGGWIVIDKSSGEMKFIEVPEEWHQESDEALEHIKRNTIALLDDYVFSRCFTDKNETFKTKFTGNKVLEYPCVGCSFRYSCWEGLQHLPSAMSKAYDRPYKYYTSYLSNGSI